MFLSWFTMPFAPYLSSLIHCYPSLFLFSLSPPTLPASLLWPHLFYYYSPLKSLTLFSFFRFSTSGPWKSFLSKCLLPPSLPCCLDCNKSSIKNIKERLTLLSVSLLSITEAPGKGEKQWKGKSCLVISFMCWRMLSKDDICRECIWLTNGSQLNMCKLRRGVGCFLFGCLWALELVQIFKEIAKAHSLHKDNPCCQMWSDKVTRIFQQNSSMSFIFWFSKDKVIYFPPRFLSKSVESV